jgi:hypothetical protein
MPLGRFPRNLIDFQRMFPHEAARAAWPVSMRRPEGFACPGRGHDHGWALRGKAHPFECVRCHRQTSVTAGTILHGSKLDLRIRVWAAYRWRRTSHPAIVVGRLAKASMTVLARIIHDGRMI